MRTTLATALLSMALMPDASAQATFHGNDARTGVFDSPVPTQFHGIKWTFQTGAPIVSSPAIDHGVLYIGSSDGNVYAIDQESGKEKWRFATRGPVSSSPAIANGMVYVLSYDGVFYAISADSGKMRWAYSTGGERRFEALGIHGLTPRGQMIADPMDLLLSSPAVSNGVVYFGSSDGHVYALDATTGVARWSFTTGDVVHASPAVVDGTVYIGSWDSYLYAINAATGQEKWRFKAGDDPLIHNQVGFQSSPAVVGGTVYVGCRDGHLYAIDAATGVKRWDYSTSQSWVNGTPAVFNGVVYFGTSDSRRFQAVDAATGVLRYTVEVESLVVGSAALADGLAIVGTFNGKLLGIDARTGTVDWTMRTNGSRADPLKVLTPDGKVNRAAFGPFFHNYLDMGVYLFKMFSVGALVSSPVVAGGVIYIGSADGLVYAIQ